MTTDQPDLSAADLIRRFPAKFTNTILDALHGELVVRDLTDAVILDPFAGVGGIHKLADRLPLLTTLGIDIEAEQAALHPRTIHGDSMKVVDLLPQLRAAIPAEPGQAGVIAAHARERAPFIKAIVTSPAYGNRLADQYLGSEGEKCQPCKGTGHVVPKVKGAVDEDAAPLEEVVCKKCGGTGKAKSSRQGYAIALNRTLSPGSGAALPWGSKYRRLHTDVIGAVEQVLAPGGWWMINVSSALGPKGYMPVMEWWVDLIAERAEIVTLRAIETPRYGHGQNRDRRVPVEHLIVARSKS